MKHPYMEAAQALDLFHVEDHSPGFAWWHPNGLRLIEALKALIRDVHTKYDYQEVKTPNMSGAELFEQSGHLAKFRHNMFVIEDGEADRRYVVRPMSCPNHISVFDTKRRSYAELPMKLFEFGEVVRNEPSGSLQALFRMRGFCQDDAHVFAMETQVVQVVADYVRLSRELYRSLGFTDIRYQISLRPEQRYGDDALWDKAEEMLRAACRHNELSWDEELGGGAFYGPKLEMHLTDALGRSWQMGVIQLDYVLPARFHLKYLGADNQEHTPVILHHAVLGSLERFVGVLLEQYGVKLPALLRPWQVALVVMGDPEQDYVKAITRVLRLHRIRAKVYPVTGRMGDAVKEALLQHPAYLGVIGRKEVEHGMVAWRTTAGNSLVSKDQFLAEILANCHLPDFE